MKSKNINITLNVRNFKVGKILHTVLIEAIADFERDHPRIVPGLLDSLKRGDARGAKDKIDTFKKTVNNLNIQVEDLERSITEYMLSQIEVEEGQAVPYINTNGDQAFSLKKDEELVLGNKKPAKKKAPAKKRAPKKKAKKEE